MEKLKYTYEYLLLLTPSGATDLIAKHEKIRLKNEFGCLSAANLKPHITVCSFLLFTRMENRLLSYFNIFSRSVQPFNVDVDGFGQFENKVIFLDIKSKKPIVDLMKEIKLMYERYMMVSNDFKPKFPQQHPHITLAKEMSPEQFEKAWPEYEKKEFKSSFEVSEMVLLKRELFSYSPYQIVQHFEFTATEKKNIQLQIQF